MITYDMPTESNQDRDKFRSFIKKLGCGMLQQSVWITPYNPQKLITEYVNENKLEEGMIIVSSLKKSGNIGSMSLEQILEKAYGLDEINLRYEEFISMVENGEFTDKDSAVFWYLIYVRQRISRESALMYVVERVTDRKIVTDSLKDELREIVKVREEIIEDEFDKLIKGALILDFEKELHFDDFIKIAAEKISQQTGMSTKNLIQLFIEREKQSCTALRPGLAIPHIIIPGKNKFEVLLVRAKQGIIFPDASDPVHIVFALVGTQDMRNAHLRALMAIAQITQRRDFDDKWQEAQKIEDLRDIILLGKRQRN